MRDLVILFVHIIATLARLPGPGGIRSLTEVVMTRMYPGIGMRFSSFYSGCAACSPSRATLLSGRHHFRAGVYSWIDDKSQRAHLLLREATPAELLKQAGCGNFLQLRLGTLYGDMLCV